MNSKVSGGGPDVGSQGLLRRAALFVALAGAVGSFGLMLSAGHRNPSRMLIFLFAVWVLSPFVALVWANVASKRWSVSMQATISVLTLAIALGGLAVYSAFTFGYVRAKTGFIFLVVPAASWLLIALTIPIAMLFSARRSH